MQGIGSAALFFAAIHSQENVAVVDQIPVSGEHAAGGIAAVDVVFLVALREDVVVTFPLGA